MENSAVIPPALQTLFTDMLATVKSGNDQNKESNKALQSSVETKINQLLESNSKLQ
jgi:hypothetical protein